MTDETGPAGGGALASRDRPAPPTFGPDVEHVRVDEDAWGDIYVVGDVHGCHDRLLALLDRLDPSPDDLVVFVGDLVRKGPDSRAVVELVRDAPNFLSVRGNNEQKLVAGEKDVPDLYPVEDYLHDLPVVVSWGDALAVHGGIDPRRPTEALSVESLLNCRAIPAENGYDGPFWFDRYDGPHTVFFGHTPLEEPVVADSAVGLDTGCVYGGDLTAYDYYAEEFVSVPGREHESRPDHKFV